MQAITVTYTLVWVLDFAEEYGKCFNRKRGKELKQVLQGGSIGYNIRSKFYTISRLKKHLVKLIQSAYKILILPLQKQYNDEKDLEQNENRLIISIYEKENSNYGKQKKTCKKRNDQRNGSRY